MSGSDDATFDSYEDLINWTFESAASVPEALDRLDQQARIYEFISATLRGVDAADLSELRTGVAETKDRYELFHDLLAPRGWALSPTLENDQGYLLVMTMLDADRVTPLEADRFLAGRLYNHPFVERMVAFLSWSAPLRALWRWAPAAADAAVAMRGRLALPAAAGWFAIFEGMWKDLQPLLGRERPRQILTSSYRIDHLTEGLTFTRESLETVRNVFVEPSYEPFLEPPQEAPTNRHSLVHGNVAGFTELHHAVKAYTLVEVTVEEAKKLIRKVDSENLELPPWR